MENSSTTLVIQFTWLQTGGKAKLFYTEKLIDLKKFLKFEYRSPLLF